MYHEVTDFWFDELSDEQKWQKNPDIDEEIRKRFGKLHKMATRGELFDWRTKHLGRLAEIIILDQFSRNLYRDDPRAFASDDMALTLAQEAVFQGIHKGFTKQKMHFLIMPFMHSESLEVQKEGLKYFEQLDSPSVLQYMYQHMAIIERFSRYPHRNKILGRDSTDEEKAFLKGAASSF